MLAFWNKPSQLLLPNVQKHAAGKETMYRQIGFAEYHTLALYAPKLEMSF